MILKSNVWLTLTCGAALIATSGSAEILNRAASGPVKTAPRAAIAPKALVAPRAAPAPGVTVDEQFAAVKAAFDASGVQNGALIIGNKDGIIWKTKKGLFDYDQAVGIASASKWLTATLLMRLVQDNKIALSDHPQQYLTFWTNSGSDSRSAATLEDFLALRSGFNATPVGVSCVSNALGTLQGCAQTIYNLGIDTAPGTTFSYGPEHPQIAAAMGEVSGGQSFNTLFANYVASPLGWTKTKFIKASNANPWAAGGAQSTALEYAVLLQRMLKGDFIYDMDNFTASRTTGLARGYVPASGSSWNYALGSWVECDTPTFTQACIDAKINSAPGAYGWLPWIDRKHGYYGLIATRIVVGEGDTVTVPIEQQLQPLVLTALGY